MRFVFALFAVTLPLPAAGQAVSGSAVAIDGDSLTVSGVEVRLYGIDAPEGKQTCERDGRVWPCGEVAAQQLRELAAGGRVECLGQGRDAYGRMLAVCSTQGLELNKAMVERGWAVAFRKYTDTYLPSEARAKQAQLGIWTSAFVPPEQYRQANQPAQPADQRSRPEIVRPRARQQAQTDTATNGCSIKGNHSRRGDWIYHLPGMPYYEQTRAEAMFCTEAEARAAGFRRSRADTR